MEAVDIGHGASIGDGGLTPGYTSINADNPANATGMIDTFQAYVYTTVSGAKIGTFSGSGNDWNDRDYETIGTINTGSVQTFTGKNCDVNTNDCIGCYNTGGGIYYGNTGGGGHKYKLGDYFGTGSNTYGSQSNSWVGIYGTGSITIALTGTATASITEADIVAGGKTIILTVTNDTWVADDGTFAAQRQNIINGIDSAQSEAAGWDAEVKAKQAVGGVVRTSDTVVTITLDAQAAYNITATETITATIPATALVGNAAVVAAPTFAITATASGPATLKTWGPVAKAAIKTIDGIPLSSIKSWGAVS